MGVARREGDGDGNPNAGDVARWRFRALPAEPILSPLRIGELGGVRLGFSGGRAATEARFGAVLAEGEAVCRGSSGHRASKGGAEGGGSVRRASRVAVTKARPKGDVPMSYIVSRAGRGGEGR